MTLRFSATRGLSIHLGTFSAWSPLSFSDNSAIRVLARRTSLPGEKRRRRDGGDVGVQSAAKRTRRDENAWKPASEAEEVIARNTRYEYDVFYRLNVSYVQCRQSTHCAFACVRRVHPPISVSREYEGTDSGSTSICEYDDNYGAALSTSTWMRFYRYARRCRWCCCTQRSDVAVACQPVRLVALELRNRTVRVKVHLTETRQTVKLQNSFGQKGMAHYGDLSDLVTATGQRVHVIASMYSFVGRSACGQMLELRRDASEAVYSRSTGRLLGYGGFGQFFVSDDSPHANFIYSVRRDGDNPIRLCRLTYESLLENNVSSAAFVKASEFQSGGNNAFAGMPRNLSAALDCYNMFGRGIRMDSQRLLATRRRRLDRLVLDALAAGGGS